MPRSLKTTGNRALDWEIDLLWQRLHALTPSQNAPTVVRPVDNIEFRPGPPSLPLEVKTVDGSVDILPTAGISLDQNFFSLVQDANGFGQISFNDKRDAFWVALDSAGAVLPTGLQSRYIPIDMACTIQRVSLYADASGSVTLDIWKCTYAQFDAGATHPVVGDSIIGAGTALAISSDTKYQDSTFTGWTTTTIADGDILAFNVKVAATNIKQVVIAVKLARTA